VHLALAFNPSHLEIVDPVVVGSRAFAPDAPRRHGTQGRPADLMHGDAAFAGQGVVMELFQMSQARGFASAARVHIVINNQVGFTTSAAEDARSTLYCTDVAKMVGAPVLHVNGDDPEAVAFCAELAYDFRQRFSKDVVIDLVCYRRHGHNEADEPAATQPLMYQKIRAHEDHARAVRRRLAAEGTSGRRSAGAGRRLPQQARRRRSHHRTGAGQGRRVHRRLVASTSPASCRTRSTPRSRATLDKLASAINTIPDEVKLHPRVAKIYEDRRKMAAGEQAGRLGLRREPRRTRRCRRRPQAAPGRPGLRPRHVLPSPCGAARADHRCRITAAARNRRRAASR
jgi:2-oxoglutarate dehydrogenase E1 component